MGCWNYQIFCDDTACDALDDLISSDSPVLDIEQFLDAVIEVENYLEYDECHYGLVAAAIVDTAMNGIDWSLLTDITYEEDDPYPLLLDQLKTERKALEPLRDKAMHVLELATQTDSELRELWEENEALYPLWLGNINKIKERLSTKK